MQEDQDSTVSLNSFSAKGQEFVPGIVVDDKYQVVSLLGKGGMGSVYRVHQIFLGKDFALKVLDLHQRTELSERRFKQEARTASQLQHPNLVGVHGFGVLPGEQPYLVMDLIEGTTLSDVLKEKRTLPYEYVVRLAVQLCFGLIYAHGKSVVHRDIKPGNIMLLHPEREPAEGLVKIVDFGIAKLTQAEDGEIQSLTKTGEVFGSPLYMSPEQCKGSAVDKRSDIYSLGCVIYECLTGVPPFFGETAMATMMKRLSERPASLKEATLGEQFPELLERIVQKMLATEPEDRYQDLSAVVNDLMALQQPEVGIAVSAAPLKPQVKKELKLSRKLSLAFATVLFAISATAVIDRAYVYPLYFAPSTKSIKDGFVLNPLGNDKGLSNGESEKLRSSRTGRSNFGTDPHENSPQLRIEKDASGENKQILFFPDIYGSISVGGERVKANGEMVVPPNAKISFRINDAAAANDQTFNNLTGLKFRRIDFNGSKLIDDRYIKILRSIPHLEQVGLEDTEITTLEPLYNSDKLNHLEVGNTRISADEILKMKGLKRLSLISFGPIPDAYRVFDALVPSTTLNNVIYKGIRLRDETRGHDLTSRDITSLAKLTSLRHLTISRCPKFNDASLARLLKLKDLNSLIAIDSGLTPACIPTLAKFKNLQEVSLTTKNWPKSALDTLRQKYKFSQRKTHDEEREERNGGIDAVRSFIDKQ